MVRCHYLSAVYDELSALHHAAVGDNLCHQALQFLFVLLFVGMQVRHDVVVDPAVLQYVS